MKLLNDGPVAAGTRRFRFVPYHARLSAATARPSALPAAAPSESAAVSDAAFSHFGAALAARRELDLTADFCAYAAAVAPLSLSLPLVFAARRRIVRATLAGMARESCAVPSLCECLAALARDLGAEFRPFLGEVAECMARLFEGGGGGAREAVVQIWDTERALVPALGALARVTKLLVQVLLREPGKVVRDLAPLLRHRHYRVREMAAEASVGYLLRKTRDKEVCERLVDAVLEGVEGAEGIDGAAAVLYEGVRSIKGGLHPFAGTVVGRALAVVVGLGEEDGKLAAVSNALAALRQLANDGDAVAELTGAILARADIAVERDGVGGEDAVADACFLLREWCTYRSGVRLRDAHLQRALELAVRVAAGNAGGGDRAVCEALGLVGAVLSAQRSSSSSGFARYGAMNKAARVSLVKAAGSVSDALTPVALQTLRAAFEARAVSVKDIEGTYAALCDRLAGSQTARTAAEQALLFLHGCRGDRASIPAVKLRTMRTQLVDFHAPVVQDWVAEVVARREGVCEEDWLVAVEICRLARAPSSVVPLRTIVHDWHGGDVCLGSRDTAGLGLSVDALVAQSLCSESPDVSGEDIADLMKIVSRIVKKYPNELGAVRAMSNLLAHRSLPDDVDGEDILEVVASNLSSGVPLLRLQSAFLITQIESCGLSSAPGKAGGEDREDELDAEEKLAALFARMETTMDRQSVFEAVFHIVSAPLTVESSSSTKQLIQALASWVEKRVDDAESKTATSVLAHAAVGLFRTKFKMLWSSAAELWSAVAVRNSSVVWPPMRLALLTSKDAVLNLSSRHTGTAGEADVTEDDAGEVQDGEDDDAEDLQDGDVGDSATHQGSTRPGSKRKLCATPNEATGRDVDEVSGLDSQGNASCQGNAKSQGPAQKRVRRTQTKGLISLRWDATSWKSCLSHVEVDAVSTAALSLIHVDAQENATDALTLHRELVLAVGKRPAGAFAERAFIIQDLFLALDPGFLSRRVGTLVVRVYAELLEKLGGLKGTGNNKELERKMRARLMNDLCRPESSCQAAVIKCLSVSRSPEVKMHRQSLLRLVDDSSFRDELALLTSKLREEGDSTRKLSTTADDGLEDVLVRICFGKMRGRRDRLGSRRSAVLGFMVSTLSWAECIPRLIKLSLAPIEVEVSSFLDAEDNNCDFGSTPHGHECAVDARGFPPLNVLRGILHSMEAVIQQFGAAIPEESWRRLIAAVYLILVATNDVSAKTVRALALRRCANMIEKRAVGTGYIVDRVVATIRRGRFDVSTAKDVTEAPALLVFLSACARAPLEVLHSSLVQKEHWVFSWALGVVSAPQARPRAVTLALDVAECLVKQIAANRSVPVDRELISCLPSAVQARLGMFRSIVRKDGKLGPWRPALEQTMTLTSALGQHGLGGESEARALLEALSGFVEDDCGRCTEAIGPTLEAMGGLFRAVCSIESKSGPADNEKLEFIARHALHLSRLLNDKNVAGQVSVRNALFRTLGSLGSPDLVAVSHLLTGLGAMRKDRVDEADYDVRLATLSHICKAVSSALDASATSVRVQPMGKEEKGSPSCMKEGIVLSAESLCALMRACLWTLKDEDSAARGTAGYALTLLAKWVTSALNGSEPNTGAVKLFIDEFLPSLVDAVVIAPEVDERREACNALGVLVRSSHGRSHETTDSSAVSPLLRGLQLLSRADDLEVDFFENVAHLQAHRRSRALRRLSTILNSGEQGSQGEVNVKACADMSVVLAVLAVDFAMPLSYRIALDVSMDEKQKNGKHSKSMEARDATRADVGVWAAAACSAAAKHLSHAEYRAVLTRILRRLPREDNEVRLQMLYTLLVSVADSFPTLSRDGETISESTNEMASYLSKMAIPQMLKHVNAGGVEGDVLSSVMAGHTKRGQGGIGNSSATRGMVFRAPVAIAATKLMLRLESEEMEVSLPLLITPVASALRSRMSDVREGAKKALVRIVILLGSKYLPYIVEQVLSVLAQGFRKDAGVYVLHALLLGIQAALKDQVGDVEGGDETVRESVPNLCVDSAAGLIADALAAELVEGVTANSKDFRNPNVSDTRAKDSASRAARAADAAELLGELIAFDKSAHRVVQSFRDPLVSASSANLAGRLMAALQRLILGLTRNSSLRADDGLVFIHEIVHDHMPLTASRASGCEGERRFSSLPRAHMMVEFGFQLLNSLLSKGAISAEGTGAKELKICSMLEPFLGELSISLQSRYDSLTLSALKVTQRLVRLPLGGRRRVAEEMTATVLEVLSRRGQQSSRIRKKCDSPGSSQTLFQTCLRVAGVIIQELGGGGNRVGGPGEGIREETVRQLLVISRQCLDGSSVEMRYAALAFVRSVVAAQFKTPELYDAVDDVSMLAVRGQSASLQSSCIAISVSFLVNYPVSAKRIRQQLEFYVRNLSYEHPDGRLAALGALETVIFKFPPASVESECEFLFLPLTAVIANDEELKCRQAAASALKVLFERVGEGRKISEMLSMAWTLLGVAQNDQVGLGWEVLGSDDPSFQKAGAAAVGAAVESGTISKNQSISALRACLSIALNGCEDDSSQPWDVTHAVLCSAERTLESMQKDGHSSEEVSAWMSPFWLAMPSMLQHQHVWVRLVVCRLLGRHFDALGEECLLQDAAKRDAGGAFSVLAPPHCMGRAIGKALCIVLEGSVLPEPLAEQAVKNLLYIGNGMRKYPEIGDTGGKCGNDEDDGEDGHDPDISVDSDGNRGLYWLLRRVAGMATRVGKNDASLLRRACAFRFLAAAVASWGGSAVKPYLRLFIAPCLRILESKAPLIATSGPVSTVADAAASATKSLAEAIQDMLVKELGADVYFSVYNELRTARRAEQAERKRKFAVEAAVDPERATKKRLKRSAAKSKARRRKSSEAGQGWRVSKASFPVEDRNPLREE